MSINSQLSCVGVIAAFAIAGCQSPISKWNMAFKESAKSGSRASSDTNDPSSLSHKSGRGDDRVAKQAGSKSGDKDSQQLTELIERGDRFRKTGQYEDARIAYSGALAIAPDNSDVHHRLAIIADKQQRFSVADQHYQAALRQRPRDVNLLSDLGFSYSLRGNSKQAEQTLKQALANDPTHRGAMANLGSIYAQQNRYSDAVAMYRKGTATEADAQQILSKLFPGTPSDEDGPVDLNTATPNSAMAASSSDKQVDLSRLTLEQLQAEVARRDQSEKPRKKSSWDETEPDNDRFEQLQANVQRTIARGSDPESSSRNQRTAQADPQVMQASGQANDDTSNSIRQASASNQASRLATKVGMNCGLGNLFPVLMEPGDMGNANDRHVQPSNVQDTRSPSGFNQSTGFSTLNSSGASLSDGFRRSQEASTNENAFGSMKPSTKSAFAARNPSWRDNLQNSASWDGDTQNADQSESSSGSIERTAFGSSQTASSRSDKLGSSKFDVISAAASRTENLRPFKGDWPKSNDIPAKSKESAFSSDQTGYESGNFSVDLEEDEGTKQPRSSVGTSSTRSPAQWPDAPNR